MLAGLFLPGINACWRGHHNRGAIALLTLIAVVALFGIALGLLGFIGIIGIVTGIVGWLAALVWSATAVKDQPAFRCPAT